MAPKCRKLPYTALAANHRPAHPQHADWPWLAPVSHPVDLRAVTASAQENSSRISEKRSLKSANWLRVQKAR